MSLGETAYTFRTPYPDMIQAGRNAVLTMPVYRNGALVAPTQSGSTFTLLDPNGTAVVNAAAVTVTNSVATCTVTGSLIPTTAKLGEGWIERWTLVLPDGTTRTVERRAALVLYELVPVISDVDLLALYPDLATWRDASVTSMQTWIDEAWARIIARLYTKRRWPYLIKSADSLRTLHIEMALMLWAQYLAKGRSGSNFIEVMRAHQQNVEGEWAALAVTWDADHDGFADDPEQVENVVPQYRLSGRRRLRASG